MASTRQCLLNQFADLSVCANQNNFHKNSILVSDLRIYLFTFNLGGANPPVVSSPCPVTQRRARNPSLRRILTHPGDGCPLHRCIRQVGGHRVYRSAPGTESRRPNASQRIVIACHKVPIQSLSLFASITTTSRSLAPSAPAAIP